ncbi:MAG: dipeptide/oligopeptide/nickel ABC transporter permease/ATP-binding protein [Mycobacteriales bacterium]
MTAIAPATTDTLAGADLGPPVLRRPLRTAFSRFPLASVAGIYLLTLIAAAAAARLVAPQDPEEQDLAHVLTGPSGLHWLGTDRLGRDVLSRLLHGARVTLLDVAVAVTVFLVLGVPLGVAAAYRGGWFDRVVARTADLLLAVPGIVVLLMVLAVFPGNDIATMVALGVIGCPGLLRIVRASTLAVRRELFVRAAQLSGLRTPAILRRHVLPSIAGPIIVQTTLFCATALLAESGLSFLGLTRPETRGPSWGNMVAEASNAMNQDQWLLVPTGGVLMLTVVAFGLVGDAVRDATMGRSRPTAVLLPQRSRRTGADIPGASLDASQAALAVRELSVSIGGRPVLRDVGFEIAAGEAVGIVGESGCGKSITAKAVIGLLPAGGAISGGHVLVDGRDLTGLDDRELNRVRGAQIGFVGQDPAGSLDPVFTVGSQLREVIRHHRPQSRREAQAEAARLLRLVRLPNPEDVLRRRPGELSGGMAQRVCIAMAIAGRPAVLIADEPTTALDVTVQGEILALLRDLQHRLGMALLLITHDWGVLADSCDRALVMYAGEIVETATTGAIHSGPHHPYTRALLAADPHRVPRGEPLLSIKGTVPKPGHWPIGCHFRSRCDLARPACGAGQIPLAATAPDHRSRCIRADELARP